MALGLKQPAKVGDELVSLSCMYRYVPHCFTVAEIRHQGTPQETLVEANRMIHNPVTCGTRAQYEEDCSSIATDVSGKHLWWECPKGKDCKAWREMFVDEKHLKKE